MVEIVGVKFREDGRIYSFSTNGKKYKVGDIVIVDTARGLENGIVATENAVIEEEKIVGELKSVVRFATADDKRRIAEKGKKQEDAMKICEEKIIKHGLDMKLVDVEISFQEGKILFYFTADGRVDFRELVKDLASVFRTRIELRQIGVRDEAKMLGGLGICGQPFCCSRFLDDFQPVSIKMAKEQGLSLNPTKISGCCGRLMCCLKYEQDAYEYLIKLSPRVGSKVKTKDGVGTVSEINLLTGKLKVRLEGNEAVPVDFHRDDVKVIRGARPQPSEADEKAVKDLED